MHKYAAFFDLDHTILDNNSGRIIGEHAYRNGLLSKKDLMTGMMFTILYKLGWMGPEKIMNKMAFWLKGVKETRLIDMINKLFEDIIQHSVREAARKEIEFHRNNGGRTILLSAATIYVCRPVKELLSMDDIICTEMAVNDGYFAGYPKNKKYCYGREKQVRAEKYCAENNLSMQDAYAYADSFSDVHLLNSVGRPMCVTPDAKLSKYAAEKGWQVCEW